MKTWIALFRGINVGGKNILPMAELRAGLESIGLKNVRTYIQSGNVVFETSAKTPKALANKISRQVELSHGFRPEVMLLTKESLAAAVAENPFPDAVSDPKSLHFAFLSEAATAPDVAALDKKKATTERYVLAGEVFYLHAPDGIARSKLASSIERHLGVSATSRNYRTVVKLLGMTEQA